MPSFVSLGGVFLLALSMILLLVVWLPLYARTFRDRIIEYRLE